MAYIKRKEILTLKRQYPKSRLDRQQAEFLCSQVETSQIGQQYDWDKPSNLPDQDLIEEQRRLMLIEQKLSDTRENYNVMQKEIDEEWKNLEQQELALRKNFVTFKHFVKENERKRDRSKTIINEETKNAHMLQLQIDVLSDKYNELKEVKDHMCETIDKMMIYKKYLEQVVDESQMDNIGNVIDKYEALILARGEMIELQRQILEHFDERRAHALKLIEDGNTKIMDLSIELLKLSSRFQKAHQEALHWEYLIIDIKKQLVGFYNKNQQAKLGLYNLYVLMCKRKEIEPTIPKHDYEQQCDFVKKTLKQTAQITKNATAAMKLRDPNFDKRRF